MNNIAQDISKKSENNHIGNFHTMGDHKDRPNGDKPTEQDITL